MSQTQAIKLRTKIIGLLLRDARLSAGESMKELGDVIGLSAGTISTIERGDNSPSLPELELLAFHLGVPIAHFWNEVVASHGPSPTASLETESLLALRHRTIGAILRQARNEKNISQKDLGERTGISASRIRRYENGETPVPVPELELLASSLGYKIEDFADSSGPIGDWITSQHAEEKFRQLPQDIKEFILKAHSKPYLDLAFRLSSLPIEKLRALADGLADLIGSTK